MRNENLHNSLVTWLEGRGRWLRAGHDNLPNYLCAMLGCGPGNLAGLKELLLGESDVLYVERTGNRITLVGLKAWRTDDQIETDEVSTDVEELWAMRASDQLEIALLRARMVDVDAVLELLAEYELELAALRPRNRELTEENAQLQLQRAAPQQSDSAEVAQLKRQLAGVISSRTNLSEMFHEKCGQLRTAQKELRTFRKLRPLLDYPAEAAAFVDFLTLANGRVGIYDGHEVRVLGATG